MQIWMTLAELAIARLPGLPSTRQGLAARAERECWSARRGQARQRVGKGGGLEFSVEILPAEAQAELVKRQMVGSIKQEKTLWGQDSLPGDAQARRDARLWVLEVVEQFARDNSLTAYRADLIWAAAYNAGNLGIPGWVQSEIRSVSREQLRTWRKIRDAEGEDALARDDRGRKSLLDTALDGEVRAFCLAIMAAKPFVSAKHIRAAVVDRFVGRLERDPSIRDVQRAMQRWEVEYRNELLRLRDPDGYRSKVEFSAAGSTRAEALNDLWQIDASPADVMLKGKRRHSIYMCIDIYSRRTIVLVTRTPRASAVGALIRKAILAWGVPRKIKTDNGSDFTANSTVRLFDALGIEIELSPPYQPKTKGNVERVIGTFQRDLATCPGFIGHSVADRKVLENRKAFNQRLGAKAEALFDVEMDLPEFQSWCDSWTDKIYGHAPHESLRRKSPFEVAAAWRGTVRRIEHPQALDILLAPIPGNNGLRKVTKTGVKVDHHHYYTAAAMPGTWVLVRMDPTDMGRIMLFAEDGEAWLGEGICPQLAGLDPVETIQKVRAAQKAYEQDRLTDIRREMRKIGPRTVSDALLREGERRAAGVVAFPQRSELVSTPALRAAAEAMVHGTSAPAAPAPDLDSRRSAVLGDLAPIPAQPVESAQDRFKRALELEAALRAGRGVDPADEAWLRIYQKQPQYQAQKMMFEEFGLSAIR
ncbi:DDE-type integrase/transposase/recombinase [Paracoccus denitrificans]|uniref:DDE-type integrase/transposase/recombinase n=1 Tax=Paracoccus denitrificans TaxID=266 RepID=UPI003364EF7B